MTKMTVKTTAPKTTAPKKATTVKDDDYQKKLRNAYKAQYGKDAPKGAILASSNKKNTMEGTGAYKVYIAPTKPSKNPPAAVKGIKRS